MSSTVAETRIANAVGADAAKWTDSAATPPLGSANNTDRARKVNADNKEGGVPTSPASNPLPPSQPSQAPTWNAQVPDGGLAAWLQVAGGFFVLFNTWGVLNTFGIFQTYYESRTLFVETSSNISWIGSIQAYLVVTLGLVSGPLCDRGYLRSLLFLGSFLIVLGFMMTSICHAFWQIALAQGFCIGAGAGLLFLPTMATLPQYFVKRLGLAVGLCASGSSLGGVVYPIIFYKLLDRLNFEWAVRIVGFIAMGTLLVPLLCMRQRIRPTHPRSVLDWGAFADPLFVSFCLCTMLGFIGLYVTVFYISYFAQATGLTSTTMAFYIVPILNAGSVFGRTLPNWVSDEIGPFNLFGPAALICGALNLALIGAHSLASVVVIAALYGFFSGVFIALPTVCFVRLTHDKTKIGTRIGMGFAFAGFGVLAGGPGAGSVLEGAGGTADSPGWTVLWLYGGIVTLSAGVLLLVLRLWLSAGRLLVKV